MSVNWTSWISTQLIKYLWKNLDPIIWSSNLRTTTEASNTPNVYSSGAVIPQYTSNQFMNVCFHKTQILMPVFQSESQFSLTSVPSSCNPVVVPNASYWLSSGPKYSQICRTSQYDKLSFMHWLMHKRAIKVQLLHTGVLFCFVCSWTLYAEGEKFWTSGTNWNL